FRNRRCAELLAHRISQNMLRGCACDDCTNALSPVTVVDPGYERFRHPALQDLLYFCCRNLDASCINDVVEATMNTDDLVNGPVIVCQVRPVMKMCGS